LSVHLVIFRRGKDYYAENVGHDPETRVSGIPFWKKRLRSGDKITLGKSEIVFFQLASPAKPKEQEEPESLASLSFVNEVQSTQHDPAPPLPRETNLIERLTPEHSESPFHLWLLMLGLVLIFTALFGVTLTLTTREKAEDQKIVAAKRLSDLGVLLTYAQLYHIEPSHQNFLDPEFLKGIAPKVLRSPFSEIDWIDKEGRLKGADYLIRIYSDGDLERFILIAQPEHRYFQWLVPSWTLILDSEEMIIRATLELKELNRLLADRGDLEGPNLEPITQKIREAEEIPLQTLASSKKDEGFLPPEELAFIDPKGSYFVYNAPRYFLFNQPLVEMAKNLSEKVGEGKDLQEELSLRIRFPRMIFYTTLGIESAIDARKILSEKWPQENHFIGYLELDKEGYFEKSHLLMMGHRQSAQEIASAEISEDEESADPLAMYHQHPLFVELQKLLESRKERIQPYHEPLVALLDEHLVHSDRQFFLRYKILFDSYQEALKREQNELDMAVNQLYDQYVVSKEEMNIPLFISMLDLAGIEVGYEEEAFLPLTRPILTLRPGIEQLEALFSWVQNAHTIPILDQAVAMAHDLLTVESFPDHHVLNSWQTQLRTLVIYKLETLLWMPHPESEIALDREDTRWMVGRILKNGYITEPDKREFYLSQIDLEKQKPRQEEAHLLSSDLLYP
jgi:hypothetical protein